jgi:endonuclease YncB( thermonuclease family)
MSSQISASPSGTLSQSLAHSAQQLTSSSSSNSIQATQITPGFTGNYTGTVNRIVDGDTFYIGKLPIRLSLVNTPERGQPGFIESKNFTAGVCDVGEKTKFNIDDKQKKSYSRTVAIVYCVEQAGQFYNVNEQLLLKGHAKVLPKFCSVSEFSTQAWVSKYCNQPVTAVSQAQANDINALYILIKNLFNIFPNNPTVIQLFNQINNLQITQNVNSQEITVIKEKVKTVVKDKEVKEKVREVIRHPDDKEIVCLYDLYHDLCPLPDQKGKCPEGWAMNEDERCYPYKKSCPEGYWRADDDESGACVKKKPPKQEPPIRCPEGSYRFDPASQTCVPLDPPPENKECPEGYMKGEAGACIKKEPPVIPYHNKFQTVMTLIPMLHRIAKQIQVRYVRLVQQKTDANLMDIIVQTNKDAVIMKMGYV